MRAGVEVYFYNAPISSHPGRVTLGTYASKPRDLVSFQGRIQDFFRRGCTRLLLYFNTNKPDSFFLQNNSCIRKPQVILRGGGVHPLHRPPRSTPGFVGNFFSRMGAALFKRIPGERPKGFLSLTEPPTI